MREHKTSCLTYPKRARRPHRPVRGSSDQRHGFWWAIGKTRLSSGERDGFRDNDAHAHEVSRRGIESVRKRADQCVQRTALIVQIKQPVMVIGVRLCGSGMD
jgi:hypothetical protein